MDMPDNWIETTSRQIAAEYDRGQYHMHADWNVMAAKWGAALSRLLHLIRPEAIRQLHVHDITCGPGTQAKGLLDRGFIVTASDCSKYAVDIAQKHLGENKHATVLLHDLNCDFAPVYHGSADFVISVNNGWSLFALPVGANQNSLSPLLQRAASLLNNMGRFLLAVRTRNQLGPEQQVRSWRWGAAERQVVVENSVAPGDMRNEVVSTTIYRICENGNVAREISRQSSLRIWNDEEIIAAAATAGLKCERHFVHSETVDSYEETWFQFCRQVSK